MSAPTQEQREAYRAARADLDRIEAVRAGLVRHTDEEYLAAIERLGDAEEECEPICTCEACGLPIFVGDKMLGGEDPLCGDCAPTYADLIATGELSGFVQPDGDGDWEPMTAERAQAIYDAHIASGGKPDDTMATLVEA